MGQQNFLQIVRKFAGDDCIRIFKVRPCYDGCKCAVVLEEHEVPVFALAHKAKYPSQKCTTGRCAELGDDGNILRMGTHGYLPYCTTICNLRDSELNNCAKANKKSLSCKTLFGMISKYERKECKASDLFVVAVFRMLASCCRNGFAGDVGP